LGPLDNGNLEVDLCNVHESEITGLAGVAPVAAAA
jgi:hypothetical protein